MVKSKQICSNESINDSTEGDSYSVTSSGETEHALYCRYIQKQKHLIQTGK